LWHRNADAIPPAMSTEPITNIRNFSIVAHIDHGKSTLADRLDPALRRAAEREMEAQVLDSMDIEKERGITIKAQTAALHYKARDGQVYNLNLIDTPGHVDFSYEVSRSLSAVRRRTAGRRREPGRRSADGRELLHRARSRCRGGTGPQQDGPAAADPDNAKAEIEDVIGIDATDADPVLGEDRHGHRRDSRGHRGPVPAPKGNPDAALRAMIVDSWFDAYVGVVMLVRVVDGRLAKGERIKMMATGATYNADNLGVFTPATEVRQSLEVRARWASSSPASRNCRPRRWATRSR
jgi:GTP-binding protein LepA